MNNKENQYPDFKCISNFVNNITGYVLENCPEVEICTLSFERYRNDSEAFYFDFSVFTKDGRKFSRKLKIGENFFELLFSNRIFLFVVKEMVKALKRKLEEKQAEIENGRRTSVDE